MQLSSQELLIKLSSVPCILSPGNSPTVVENEAHFFLVDTVWTLESDPVSSPEPTKHCLRLVSASAVEKLHHLLGGVVVRNFRDTGIS